MTGTPLSRSKGQRSRSLGRFGCLFKSLLNLNGRQHSLRHRPEWAAACRPWGGGIVWRPSAYSLFLFLWQFTQNLVVLYILNVNVNSTYRQNCRHCSIWAKAFSCTNRIEKVRVQFVHNIQVAFCAVWCMVYSYRTITWRTLVAIVLKTKQFSYSVHFTLSYS